MPVLNKPRALTHIGAQAPHPHTVCMPLWATGAADHLQFNAQLIIAKMPPALIHYFANVIKKQAPESGILKCLSVKQACGNCFFWISHVNLEFAVV
mmetsp:Transcript_16719/g.36172  ORF Transcript_16719/g.36172 Transcript_16719/m.36172 type:complete len:96 (-) Transcript_16719:510-797(-)